MSTKKYQIFISSTYEDLKEERISITEAILEEKHIPIGMELFSTSDTSQWDYIKKRILESDYYVLVIGHRYGSIDETTEEKISYTEKEYDFALENKIPIMSFVIDNKASVTATQIENDGIKLNKLNDFKGKVKNKLCKFYKNKYDLKSNFKTALNECIIENPKPGWIKADDLIVKNHMMRIDIDFVEKLFNKKIQMIQNSLVSSYTKLSNVKDTQCDEKLFKIENLHNIFNRMLVTEVLHQKAFQSFYENVIRLKSDLMFLLSNTNIKLDFRLINHFYEFLGNIEHLIGWIAQIEEDSINDKTYTLNMLKENKSTNMRGGNHIDAYIRYYHCTIFVYNWLVNYTVIRDKVLEEI